MNNLLLSVNKLEHIQICPRLFKYEHLDRLTPIASKSYLDAGDFMHWMLKQYYIAKLKNETFDITSFRENANNWAALNSPLSTVDVETTITDFEMYLNYYGPKDSFTIEAVEEPFAKELYVEDDFRVVLVGKVDLRIKKGNDLRIIVDHKYEGQFREKRNRNNQPLAYCWAFDIHDFMYNRIGKQKSYKPEQRLARPYFNYASYQIKEWHESAVTSAREIVRHAKEDYWPARFTACSFHGNRCTFYDLCDSSASMQEHKRKDLFRIKDEHDIMSEEK